jgi:acylphosphatase
MRIATRIMIRLDKRDSGFRFYAYTRGKVLGIHGSITYYGDKQDIAIHAEGKDAVLHQYINILRQGTPFSKVISIMSIPDRMLNSDYYEILPAIIPEAIPRIEEPPLFGFKIGLFGF